MQFDDLQRQWQQLERKLDQCLALDTELLRRAIVQPARRRVHRVAIGPTIDTAFGLAVMVFIGNFLYWHWREARLAAPAVVVALGGLSLLIASVCQLARIAELDWGGPVAAIQNSLATLRAARIRQFQWVILLAPLVGFCALIVGLHSLVGWATGGQVDILDKLDSRWVIGNYVFGVLFVPVGYLLARSLAFWGRSKGWWQSLLDDIAGVSLKSAQDDVARWADLCRDSSADNI